MNKEQTKMSKEMAICILKEYKSISEDRKLYHKRLILEKKDSDFVLDKEQVQRSEKDIEDFNKNIQALDIAIESLDNEWVNIGKKKPTHEKDILIYDTKGDISLGHYVKDKRYFHDYKLGYENPFVIAWRELKVEPYERKE